MLRPLPTPTLFPYTTLFRSLRSAARTDVPIPVPAFWGAREIEVDMDEVYRHLDRKSTRLNSSHRCISYAVFCLKKKTKQPSEVSVQLSESSSGRRRRLQTRL